MRLLSFIFLMTCGGLAFGGFGVQVGALSPNSGIEDNDNSVLLGANLSFKFAVIGVKLEGYYVDSSGRYDNLLGEEFGAVDIDMEAIISADVMFYPIGGLFFLQAGVNYISFDASNLTTLDDRIDDIIDNELGIQAGLGVTILDKLTLQGKVLYTPDAIRGEAVDAIRNLDENFVGYLVTVGWEF